MPRVLFLLLLLVAHTRSWAEDAAPSKTVRLLTIGNSFSGNATRNLKELAKASGDTLILGAASVGGASLELHWSKVEAFEKDPANPSGRYGSGRSLKEELTSEPWDFVTIQQASLKSHDLSTYRPFAKQFYQYIKQHAPEAEVLLHQTWAYRQDDARFAPGSKATKEPATQAEMYEQLTAAYRTIATELGVRRIPVGDAFHLADTDPQWGYKPDKTFDFKTAERPALPDQTHSLHVGWKWIDGKDGNPALSRDGHHAGVAGEYLGGCVFYEVIFGKTAVGNRFTPKGLDLQYARFLQETAHRAVEGVSVQASTR